RQLSFPPVGKPIGLVERKAGQPYCRDDTPLVLISLDRNQGFATGNNLGLRYALSDPRMSHVWVLNNDTVVDRDALRALIDRLEVESGAGICGSTIVLYHQPDRVQLLGGCSINKWILRSHEIQSLAPLSQSRDRIAVEQKMDFVYG